MDDPANEALVRTLLMHEDLVAAVVDSQHSWHGSAMVARIEDEQLVDVRFFGGNNYVKDLEWITDADGRDPIAGGPVLAVWDSSHMGNGSLRLMQFTDDGWRSLLEVPGAVDHHRGSDQMYLVDGRMKIRLQPINEDECIDLMLHGTRQWTDPDDAVYHRENIEIHFVWDAETNQFLAESGSHENSEDFESP